MTSSTVAVENHERLIAPVTSNLCCKLQTSNFIGVFSGFFVHHHFQFQEFWVPSSEFTTFFFRFFAFFRVCHVSCVWFLIRFRTSLGLGTVLHFGSTQRRGWDVDFELCAVILWDGRRVKSFRGWLPRTQDTSGRVFEFSLHDYSWLSNEALKSGELSSICQ